MLIYFSILHLTHNHFQKSLTKKIVFFNLFLSIMLQPVLAKSANHFALIHQKPVFPDESSAISLEATQKWNCMSNLFGFVWGVPGSWARRNLLKHSQNGVYVTHVNIVNIDQHMSDGGVAPPLKELRKHPDWFMYNTDGSVATYYKKDRYRMDIGNEEYIRYTEKWLKNMLNNFFPPHNGIGIDSGMFYRADPKWMKYNTDTKWQEVWERFLSRMSSTFRPKYKIILNVGSSDFETFTRMIRQCDGCIVEFFSQKGNTKLNRSHIMGWMEKASWCENNQKICVLRDLYTSGRSIPSIPYGYINFLLIKGKYIYYCIKDNTNNSIYFKSMFVDIGEALGNFVALDPDLYLRDFKNAVIVSNLGQKEKVLQFNNELRDLEGHDVGKLNLKGTSGVILMKKNKEGVCQSIRVRVLD